MQLNYQEADRQRTRQHIVLDTEWTSLYKADITEDITGLRIMVRRQPTDVAI